MSVGQSHETAAQRQQVQPDVPAEEPAQIFIGGRQQRQQQQQRRRPLDRKRAPEAGKRFGRKLRSHADLILRFRVRAGTQPQLPLPFAREL